MSTMFTEVYTAFKKAGVPEEDAVRAAEALSNVQTATKADIVELRKDIASVDKRIYRLEILIAIMIAVLLIPSLTGLFG
ncbi:MAG: hypothetical protein WCS28_04990 [Thiomicrospira sp.]